jgi:ATP-binding cassette, subfamily B, multidrug efflux pump
LKFDDDEIVGKAYDSRLMRRLLLFLRPYRRNVLLAVCLLLTFAASQLVGPFLTKIAIDNYITQGNFSGLQTIAIIFVIILVFQFVLNYTQQYLTAWIGQNVMYDIRVKIFSHLQNLPLSFFDKNPVGRMVTRVTNDVETLNNMLSSGVVAIFGDVFVLVGIIIVMLFIHWQLALLTFTVLPLIILASFLFRIKVRESYRKIRTRIARINSYLQENISGMMTVQLFNREKNNYKRFSELNHSHKDAHLQTVRYYAIFYPAIEIISSISLALILWYGGIKILSDSITIGVLVAFIQYAERFFQPIRDLSDKYNIMQAAMASSERIFKLLDEPEQELVPKRPLSLPPSKGKIEFKNVTFAYNENENVLEDVSFTINPGEKVAVVGATGAGKTTLTSLISRLYETTSGQILLDGVDINRLPVQKLRQRIGIVLQDVFVFTGAIKDNIILGNSEISNEQMIQSATYVNANNFIDKFPDKYNHTLTEKGRNLSTGQKQLLSFARALAFDPEILILDEATSSVDTKTEELISDAINKLLASRTSLIIAHRLSTIQNVDWIIVLHKGHVREIGTHQALMKMQGIYYRLYQLQFSKKAN